MQKSKVEQYDRMIWWVIQIEEIIFKLKLEL